MKRIFLTILFSLFALLTFTSCDKEQPMINPDDVVEGITEEEIYQQIYNGNFKEKYNLMPENGRHKASYGYAYNSEQGYNYWYYAYLDNSGMYKYLDYDSTQKLWICEDATINNAIMHPTKELKVARCFAAPITGKVLLNGNPKVLKNSDATLVEIYVNNDLKYRQTIEKNDTVGYYYSFEVQLKENDMVYFVVNNGENIYVDWNPIVDYTCQDLDTLYYVPEWGYYGDIHCYYYNNELNLYHLRNLPNNNWEWYQMSSNDMFIYKETSIYSTDFVKNHYMAYANGGDLNDYKMFPDGARDCTKFYDEDVDKYRWIGLGYVDRHKVHTSLYLRTSDDSDGWMWNSETVVLRDFPTTPDGEPECAAFRKIGNRWYLYCGISGQSSHGIGRLSYWIGGEGQSIDEVDWASLETHTLDGEDLCVPQIENVNGKWYMFGWMPKTWNGFHWGGPRNMPREVFQNEDGTLGTKFDPYATRLMNKGKILLANEDNVTKTNGNVVVGGNEIAMNDITYNKALISGTYKSTFITYDLKLLGTKAGMILSSNGVETMVSISKESDGIYLIVETVNDLRHPINSKQLLSKKDISEFNIKMIVENGIIEFAVNDLIVLSARTALTYPYTAQLYSIGQAKFNNVSINRFAQVYDIYE